MVHAILRMDSLYKCRAFFVHNLDLYILLDYPAIYNLDIVQIIIEEMADESRFLQGIVQVIENKAIFTKNDVQIELVSLLEDTVPVENLIIELREVVDF